MPPPPVRVRYGREHGRPQAPRSRAAVRERLAQVAQAVVFDGDADRRDAWIKGRDAAAEAVAPGTPLLNVLRLTPPEDL